MLADNVDLVMVIGDRASSNSRRLVEVAVAKGTPAHLIGNVADIQDGWLNEAATVGITAGASTPEEVVQEVVGYLSDLGAAIRHEVLTTEAIAFALPPA
jgi:4-hydroxy-3-methylbut-2-en-1-yl diphosphate reductase